MYVFNIRMLKAVCLSVSVSLSWICWVRGASCWWLQVVLVSAASSEPPTCRGHCSCWRSCGRLPLAINRNTTHLTPEDIVSTAAARNHGSCSLQGLKSLLWFQFSLMKISQTVNFILTVTRFKVETDDFSSLLAFLSGLLLAIQR